MRALLPFAALVLLTACSQNAEAPASEESTAAPAPAPAPRPEMTEEQRAAVLASLPAPYNEGDLENGRRVFARCRSCHTLAEGGGNLTGPHLWGVFGRPAGSVEGFRYGDGILKLAESHPGAAARALEVRIVVGSRWRPAVSWWTRS